MGFRTVRVEDFEFRVWGFRIWALGRFRVEDFGFRVWGFRIGALGRFRVEDFGFRVWGFRIWALGRFRVEDFGFRVWGLVSRVLSEGVRMGVCRMNTRKGKAQLRVRGLGSGMKGLGKG